MPYIFIVIHILVRVSVPGVAGGGEAVQSVGVQMPQADHGPTWQSLSHPTSHLYEGERQESQTEYARTLLKMEK